MYEKKYGRAWVGPIGGGMLNQFRNDDSRLIQGVEGILAARRRHGLDGLVGGLEAVIITVESGDLLGAAAEFLGQTGYAFRSMWEGPDALSCLLGLPGSADVVIRSRKGTNPFRDFNEAPRTRHKPNARLETFVFGCHDLTRYVEIQHGRGVSFLTPAIIETPTYAFIQTRPSAFTGNSLGFIQWKGEPGRYEAGPQLRPQGQLAKPDRLHLAKIGRLDHAAARVKAQHRDDAILEFLDYTNYEFKFSVFVDFLNSITNVARLGADDFAMVFTSGISPFDTASEAGPTEQFIVNYGTRVHHLAFETRDIESVFKALKADGMGFLVDLVGSPSEGIRQTFSRPSALTFLVNEYIQRFDGFDGFFTRSNVTLLTKATEGQ